MHRHFSDAGYRVFGLHRFGKDGCACGDPGCKAAGKHPIARNWQHTPAWDDEQLETFEALGQFEQGYGLLVAGLLVVDIDARNGGLASYQRLLERVPELAGAGLVVNTGSGGGSRHLYFRAPDGVALVSHLREYPGVDFKSSGYVVGPGSWHASGGRYEIAVGDVESIGDAPTGLVALLRKPDTHRALVQGEPVDVADEQIAQMLASIDPDCAHEDWIRVGMALHDLSGGAGFKVWDAWSQSGGKYPGRAALDARWHSFGKSANPVRFGTLLKIAGDYGWQMPVTFDAPAPQAEPEPTASKPRHERWLDWLLEPDDAALERMANQAWLIDGILPERSIVGVIGASGAGKSFVALDMACSIASGHAYHGREVEAPGAVIYVSAEGAAGLRVRKRAWEQSHSMLASDMRILPDAPLIDNEAVAHQLVATILEYTRRTGARVRMIVLDTLNRVMAGEENSATAMGAVLRGADALQAATGATIAIVHHMGHGETGRGRGSSALYAGMEVEIIVRAIGERVAEVACSKMKDADKFDPYRLTLEKFQIAGLADAKGRPFSTLVPRPATLLEEGEALGKPGNPTGEQMLTVLHGPMGRDAWLEAWRSLPDVAATGDGKTRAQWQDTTLKTFRRALSALVASGLVARAPGKDRFQPG